MCSLYLSFKFMSSLTYLFWLNLCQTHVSQSMNWCVHLWVAIFIKPNGWNVSPKYFLNTDVFCHTERKVCLLLGANCRAFLRLTVKELALQCRCSVQKSMDGDKSRIKNCSWASEDKKHVCSMTAFPFVCFWWLGKGIFQIKASILYSPWLMGPLIEARHLKAHSFKEVLC